MTTKDAVDHLIEKLKSDEGFRESWRSTIALSFYDKYQAYKIRKVKKNLSSIDINIISDEGAEYFLKQFCGEIKYIKGR